MLCWGGWQSVWYEYVVDVHLFDELLHDTQCPTKGCCERCSSSWKRDSVYVDLGCRLIAAEYITYRCKYNYGHFIIWANWEIGKYTLQRCLKILPGVPIHRSRSIKSNYILKLCTFLQKICRLLRVLFKDHWMTILLRAVLANQPTRFRPHVLKQWLLLRCIRALEVPLFLTTLAEFPPVGFFWLEDEFAEVLDILTPECRSVVLYVTLYFSVHPDSSDSPHLVSWLTRVALMVWVFVHVNIA